MGTRVGIGYRWLLARLGWTGAPRSVQRALVFSMVAGGYFLFLRYAHNQRHFYYDSVHYWNVATTFSLDDYKDVLRGYAFPFLCLALRRLSLWLGTDEFVTFWAASALGMAALGAIIVPVFVRTLLPQLRFGWWSVIAFNALLFIFFRGYAAYPLTDFPAAALLLVSYWCVLAGWRWSLLGGLALALAISFRPIYLIGGPGFALLLGLRVTGAFRARQFRSALLGLALSAVGFGVGMGPQVYVNHHNFQRLSLLPPTDVAYKKSLYLAQIDWGLTIQRADTSIGKTYPSPSVFFHDRTGKLISEAEKNAPISSYRDWLTLWKKYPRSLVAIYSRHLFNGLDVVYPTPYIRDPYQRPVLSQLLNYSLWFVFLSGLGALRLLKDNWTFIVVLGGLLLPVAAVIPTAIEVRFFLPLHLILYATLAFGGSRHLWRLRRASIGVAICFVLFQLACHALSDTTFSNQGFPGTPI